VAYLKRYIKGSLFTEIILWLCALLPGLIYSIWRRSTEYWGCPQCGSPNPIPLTSPAAQKFLSESNRPISDYRVPVTKPGGLSATQIIYIFAVILVLGLIERVTTLSNGIQQNTQLANVQSTGAATDADQLVMNCGTPFKDDSTAYDSPRPPIVTRFIDYKVKGVHLRFVYVPGNGHVGDPPPYDWKLQMVANIKTNKLYNHDQLSKLMWCADPLPPPHLVNKDN
jgi:hypothetical protein